jgi:nucleoside-diphosphate-sugar epimerase
MKILVIGSEGFVGQSFCSYLRTQGNIVVPFDVKRSPKEDARNVSLPLEGISQVYFLAWEVGGAKYLYEDDVQFVQLDWNLQLLLNTMPQLREAKVPFLFVSSQLAEECDTVYGVTKRLGEVWTDLLEGVRVRLWNVYGAYEDSTRRSHVVADFVHQAIETGRIEMMTTGEELRQFIYIDDVCRGLERALQNRENRVCDLSSFEWVSIRHVADTIAEIVGADVIPGKHIGSTPVTPMKGRIPGWLPTTSLKDGLTQTVELYQSCLQTDKDKEQS